MARSKFIASKRRFMAGLAALSLSSSPRSYAQTNTSAENCYFQDKAGHANYAISMKAETNSNGGTNAPFFTSSITLYPRLVSMKQGYVTRTPFSVFNASEGEHALFAQDSQSLRTSREAISLFSGNPMAIVNIKIPNVGPKPLAGYATRYLKSGRVKISTENGTILMDSLRDFRGLNLATGEKGFPLSVIPITVEHGLNNAETHKWISQAKSGNSLRVEIIDPDKGETLLTANYSPADAKWAMNGINANMPSLISKFDSGRCMAKVAGAPCFMTTAACNVIGLDDKCWELETLRAFRDQWLVDQTGGQEDIQTYYTQAPTIISAIQDRQDATQIWLRHYWCHILPAAFLVRLGAKKLARAHYTRMMTEMQVYI